MSSQTTKKKTNAVASKPKEPPIALLYFSPKEKPCIDFLKVLMRVPAFARKIQCIDITRYEVSAEIDQVPLIDDGTEPLQWKSTMAFVWLVNRWKDLAKNKEIDPELATTLESEVNQMFKKAAQDQYRMSVKRKVLSNDEPDIIKIKTTSNGGALPEDGPGKMDSDQKPLWKQYEDLKRNSVLRTPARVHEMTVDDFKAEQEEKHKAFMEKIQKEMIDEGRIDKESKTPLRVQRKTMTRDDLKVPIDPRAIAEINKRRQIQLQNQYTGKVESGRPKDGTIGKTAPTNYLFAPNQVKFQMGTQVKK